jgi:hypothetical protein
MEDAWFLAATRLAPALAETLPATWLRWFDAGALVQLRIQAGEP